MTRRTAIQPDLFAAEEHRAKLDRLGDPLQEMDSVIDFAALAAEVEKIFPSKDQSKGGRPPYPIETMVRIVVLKRLYGLSDEQMEYQLLDRTSFKRFCGLEHSRTIPDRTTIWLFENRIGAAGAQALFEAVKRQIERKGYIARGGQIVDATPVARSPSALHSGRAGDRGTTCHAPRVEAGQTPSKRPGCHLDQETRQELLRLQTFGLCRSQAQAHPAPEDRHGQHPRQPALRGAARLGQHLPRATSTPTGATRARSERNRCRPKATGRRSSARPSPTGHCPSGRKRATRALPACVRGSSTCSLPSKPWAAR